MVSFHALNKSIHTAAKLSKLIESKETRHDSETLDICSSVAEDLTRMQEELKPMIKQLGNHEQQIILTLRFLKGFDYSWIAAHLAMSERMVYYYLKAAKKQLQALYPDQVEP